MTLGEKISYLLMDEYCSMYYIHTSIYDKDVKMGYTIKLPLENEGIPSHKYFQDEDLETCVNKAILYLFERKLEN